MIKQTLSQFNESTEETVLLEEQERRAGVEVEIRSEWDAHPSIQSHFRQPELESYRQLRPLYQARGIQNPAEYLDNNIVQVTFFGNSTPAHTDMSAPLQAAENALSGQGINPVIHNYWAFVPRLTASGNLSNHAEGRAVDINRQGNPHIRNQHEIRVIRAVTGVDLGMQQGANVMRQASQTFQSTFSQQWVDQQTQQLQQLQAQANPSQAVQQQIEQLEQLIDSISRRRQALNGYAQRGFFNIQQSLVDALVNAGFSWGGQWQHSKDFMHFEL
ncbi:MAG: M15 family metallopeptidase [Chloroflexi bacterium]|nr:M15 family metallopeptidase [Chloroflexota bacterium]